MMWDIVVELLFLVIARYKLTWPEPDVQLLKEKRSVKDFRDLARTYLDRANRATRVSDVEKWTDRSVATMKIAHESLNDSSERFKRNVARCAWEIAKCYERGLSHPLIQNVDHQRKYHSQMEEWLWKAVNADLDYVQHKANMSPRSGDLKKALSKNQKLLVQVFPDMTPAAIGVAKPTRQPIPLVVTPKAAFSGSYDPDYAVSHYYHKDAAHRFEEQANWQEAIKAWQNAIWMLPLFRYRLALTRAMIRYVALVDPKTSSDYLCQVECEVKMLEQDHKDDVSRRKIAKVKRSLEDAKLLKSTVKKGASHGNEDRNR